MRYIKLFITFIKDIFQNRRLLWELTIKDFQQKYLGSYLGILWAFIQPTITVLIFWFVFQVGFKSMPVQNYPFILWLVCGFFPWFFISESILAATTSITDNIYLVKKVVFRVSLLPIIKIISSFIIHIFFIVILLLMFIVYGYWPTVYSLQVFYYFFAAICLVLGMSWITSSLIIFFKDMGQFVGMIMQFGFWLTPIFWSIQIVPEEYRDVIKLNPFYYIINGYRESFIYHKWFWEDWNLTLYYWGITVAVLLIGGILFKKLRPHFADVL